MFDNLFTNQKLIVNFCGLLSSLSFSYSSFGTVSMLYRYTYNMRGHGRRAMPESLDIYSSGIYAEDSKAVAKAFKIALVEIRLMRPFQESWRCCCILVDRLTIAQIL